MDMRTLSPRRGGGGSRGGGSARVFAGARLGLRPASVRHAGHPRPAGSFIVYPLGFLHVFV
eukprot:4543996-Lingulodinium_polyedra.AAC.1